MPVYCQSPTLDGLAYPFASWQCLPDITCPPSWLQQAFDGHACPFASYLDMPVHLPVPGHACPFASSPDMPVHLPVAWTCLSICQLPMLAGHAWPLSDYQYTRDVPVHLTVSNACWTCLSICQLPGHACPFASCLDMPVH